MKLTTSQALLKFLSNQYIFIDDKEHLFVHGMFTIFGHGNAPGLGDALENCNFGLKSYRANNEQGMANASIAYSKQMNRLGIIACTSSIGPGALNMVTSAGIATSNRIPLLILPGDVFADRQPDPVLQQIEQPHDATITANDAFKPVSKYWDRIVRPEMLMSASLNAMRVLTDPAETGAVVLSLPQDVQAEYYDYPDSFFQKRIWFIDRPIPNNRTLYSVAKILKSSYCPLIVSGGGVHYSLATKNLDNFSKKHGIAVAETQAGKSSISEDNFYNLGGIGTTGSLSANILAKESDVILAIGTRFQDFTTASKSFYRDAKIIQININTMDRYKLDSLAVHGDIRATLEKLSNILCEYRTSDDYKNKILLNKKNWLNERSRLCKNIMSKDGLFNQAGVLSFLNNNLKPDDTVICAAGSLPGDLHKLWQSKKPKDYHVEYGFSCMGYEVSAGLGVSLAKSYQKSLGKSYVLVGDGSYLMLHSEIVTAIQENQSFTIILFDNGGFQCINNLQKSFGSKGFCTELRFRDIGGAYGTKNLSIDFAKYAEALGVKSYKVRSESDLKEAFKNTQSHNGVSLVELKISPKTMTQSYESWWRIGVSELSLSKDVQRISAKTKLSKKNIRKY